MSGPLKDLSKKFKSSLLVLASGSQALAAACPTTTACKELIGLTVPPPLRDSSRQLAAQMVSAAGP